ncbi:3-hydroxybenzoate 6-hydroxylase 1 [Roseovarius albus]|uniref:3-hydroxybenzoate 6-hydroxylase 1 n=1 Tax=Roseovarius albus TaxID=1247867 RepID=A0A1X6YBV2_9RHOB|nr:FAD-dependent monooxygenase [Roseovarius albus]SLN16687.1 3-hydroxybenzoate 6-hydroxylase 1 [Roseovarius albus]
MTLNGMKIAIIGAGIGGLAAARALALRGAKVTVLEQTEAIKEVGAGIQISPNGFAVLNALGLGDNLSAQSVQAQAVNLIDYRGKQVTRLDLSRLQNQSYFFLHRSDLIAILADGARQAGAKLRLLQHVERISTGEKPVVHLANGAEFKADLVIGADGLHSVVRTAINGTSWPFFTNQVAWRTIVPNTFDRGPEVQLHMGPHRHLVSYPIRSGEYLNIVAVQERAAWAEESWSQKDDPTTLQAAFSDFCPEAQQMLSQVKDVNLWGLFRHAVAPLWYADNVTLLGDAAHPTLPFMAQGASMALEDAWVLADCLERVGTLKDRLSNYQSLREHRTRKIVDTASGNAWKYHLSFPPLRWAAHSAMRLGGRFAPDKLLHQFDWIYNHDVTQDTPASPR